MKKIFKDVFYEDKKFYTFDYEKIDKQERDMMIIMWGAGVITVLLVILFIITNFAVKI